MKTATSVLVFCLLLVFPNMTIFQSIADGKPADSGPLDLWVPLSVPDFTFSPHSEGTAVWTGTEMIIWGGWPFGLDGLRYEPATDTWRWMNPYDTDTPCGRYGHTAIWTGTEMVVYGGEGPYNPSDCDNAQMRDQGNWARYNPANNSWTTIDAYMVPHGHTAIWTGREMIIWGGKYNQTYIDYGQRFDLTTGIPTPIPPTPHLAGRYMHTAVWTGTEVIIWGGGGASGQHFGDGARYNPATDTWTPLPSLGAPTSRFGHTAIWTGTEMIIWGGSYGSYNFFGDGARYDPATDTWTPLPSINAPAGRYQHTGVWTGREMIIWGGRTATEAFGDGARYDPITDSWTPLPAANAPSPRYGHTAVWTGMEMIVHGGSNGAGGYLQDGARYKFSPDLQIAGLTNPPEALTAGGSFSVTDSTWNYGLGPSEPSTTRYYLSHNRSISKRDVLLIGSRSVPVLNAGGISQETVTVTISNSTKPGFYYLLACADDLGDVTESDETNNCFTSFTKIKVK